MSAIVGALRVVLGADTVAFERGLTQAERQLRRVGRQMRSIGSQMSVAITAPLAGIAAAALKVSADFERAMSNVSTLIDTTAESMGRMSAEVLALGRRLPVPIADLTAALYDIRSAGIDASDAMSVLEGSARLAVSGLGTTREATDLVTSALNAFRLQGDDAARVYDTIFKTVQFGKTTITQLAQGFGAVAGTVANAGIRLDEYLASIAALTTTGIPAAQAHTMIRAAIAGLTRETDLSRRVFEHLGARSFRDLIAKSGGMVAAFNRIRQALGGNDAQMLRLFGSTEALGAVISLTGNQAGAFRTALDSMRNGANAVDEAFRRQRQTLSAATQVLTNNLQALAVEIGTALLPAIRGIAEAVSGAVEAFNALDPATKTIVAGMVALAAAIGPVLVGLGLLSVAIAAISIPVAATVAAIAAVAAGIVYFWDQIKGVAEFILGPYLLAMRVFRQQFAPEVGAAIRARTTDLREWAAAARGVAEAQRLMSPGFSGVAGKGPDPDEAAIAAAIDAAARGATDPVMNLTNATAALAEQWRAVQRDARMALDAVINAPTETFAAKMAAVEEAVRRGTIGFREFQRVVQRIKDENVQQMHDLASATSSALTTIFGKSKVAAIAAAVINTAQGITRNLAQYPQPLAGIMAAITAASGAAQIAAIKSTNMGGGGGGAASAPAGGAGSAAAAGPTSAPQQLFVHGVGNPSVRDLIEELLQLQRDGHQVVLQPT